MNEAPLLADLQEGVLDAARLEAVVGDIAAHTQVLMVLVKGGAAQRSADQAWKLDEAVAALRSGTIRGIQIRYRWNEQEWWDTILSQGAGFRLVRMQQAYR